MLDYLYDKSKRLQLSQDVNDCDFTSDSIPETMRKFLEIFVQNRDYVQREIKEQLQIKINFSKTKDDMALLR